MGEAASSSEVTQVAAATSSQDPEVGLAAVAALRGLVEVLEALQVENARAKGWCRVRGRATPNCWAYSALTWRQSAAPPSRPSAARRWGGRSGRRPGRDAVGLGECRERPCATRR